MKHATILCFVCGTKLKPRNNVERSKVGKKRARFSCSPLCQKELRRIQQARRRGASRSRLIPQLRLAL